MTCSGQFLVKETEFVLRNLNPFDVVGSLAVVDPEFKGMRRKGYNVQPGE